MTYTVSSGTLNSSIQYQQQLAFIRIFHPSPRSPSTSVCVLLSVTRGTEFHIGTFGAKLWRSWVTDIALLNGCWDCYCYGRPRLDRGPRWSYVAVSPTLGVGDTTACPGFFIGQVRRPRAGWVLGEGTADPPHQPWDLEERCELPSGFRGGGLTAQRFPLFSALGIATPDTLILLIVDYHAATEGKTSCPHPCTCRCADIAAPPPPSAWLMSHPGMAIQLLSRNLRHATVRAKSTRRRGAARVDRPAMSLVMVFWFYECYFCVSRTCGWEMKNMKKLSVGRSCVWKKSIY